MNNLKQVSLGLLNYHDGSLQLPPAFVADDRGRPAHSWRILMLPFLNERELYVKYEFAVSWNSPQNRKLADPIPLLYRCPSFEHHQEHESSAPEEYEVLTQYVTLRGKDTAFPGASRVAFDQIAAPRGTLLLVEVGPQSRRWMSPEDLSAREFSAFLSAGEKDRLHHLYGVNVALADGSCTFLQEKIDRDVLERLMTIDGSATDD